MSHASLSLSLSLSLAADISGAAWLLERSHPHLTSRQLARAARRELARETIYTRATCHGVRVSRTESAECGDHVGLLADESADTVATVTSREDVARCLATCNRIDHGLVSAMLASLADGTPRAGVRACTLDSERLALECATSSRTLRRRIGEMRAACRAE